ncbi:hypothetical protein [Mycobacterium sp. shizuoka-1]|uniref:hypothetical protein n=1 Tax=Mycobacterium sp. shizuoka-1 TaxID=2039281 RepID=UPI000C062647|nr:hypothetical protein [Mycobacterium sp. shizuoka-1]GAY14171.1 hypothetical protein MSZK_08970 [Mycobacterium sp. shizuoka-1]
MWRQAANAALFGIATAALTACGGSSGGTATTTATVEKPSTTVATPTLAYHAPRGAAVNAQYWLDQINEIDSATKQFADSQATDFCKNPKAAHLTAQMISMGTGLGILSIPYALQNKDYPAWKDDPVAQAKIAYYIVSNYCPEAPS